MSSKNTILILAGAITLIGLGRWSSNWGASAPAASHQDHGQQAEAPEQETLWTCPMHPQIQLPDEGDCPICGMDLVPMVQGAELPTQLVMSESSKELSRVMTATVERRSVEHSIRMVGKVDYDESAVKTISAWVPGRLDRMFVDYTGVRVQEGDHLVWLYSPDLLTAQEELLSARARMQNTAGEASAFLAESNQRAYEAAREKLILWGLTESQVQEVEDRGTAEDHMMLTSPTSGVVIEKRQDEGAYVQTGSHLYRIADLGHLWVRLDAYEQDLTWLRYGQEVTLQAEALPGHVIEGRISFLDFEIDGRTRTANVRVNVDNSHGLLKPGMFVRAIVNAQLGSEGQVLDPYLVGKWVCPMHPEVVEEEAGDCNVCGMPLVSAEELGLVSEPSGNGKEPIVVPRSAVLITGRRAIVYIEVQGTDRPTYEGREVVLGPRAGEAYIVLSGLQEGEEIVINGAFRIDSAMQIKAKPSMMSMGPESPSLDGPGALQFRDSMRGVYDAYMALQSSLAGDDEAAARIAVDALRAALPLVQAGGLDGKPRDVWLEESAGLTAALESAATSTDMEALRTAFHGISNSMLKIAREFGHAGGETYYEAHCPMAFDFSGASWLQTDEEIFNPYFGSEMLHCGSIEDTFDGSGDAR